LAGLIPVTQVRVMFVHCAGGVNVYVHMSACVTIGEVSYVYQ